MWGRGGGEAVIIIISNINLYFQLHCSFKDADDFHTEENKKKMNCGIPLTDEVTNVSY